MGLPLPVGWRLPSLWRGTCHIGDSSERLQRSLGRSFLMYLIRTEGRRPGTLQWGGRGTMMFELAGELWRLGDRLSKVLRVFDKVSLGMCRQFAAR